MFFLAGGTKYQGFDCALRRKGRGDSLLDPPPGGFQTGSLPPPPPPPACIKKIGRWVGIEVRRGRWGKKGVTRGGAGDPTTFSLLRFYLRCHQSIAWEQGKKKEEEEEEEAKNQP